jgi:hypothetical protein
MPDKIDTKSKLGLPIYIRITLSIGLTALAWYSAVFVIGQVTRKAQPEAALDVQTNDPIALAIAADRLLLESLKKPELKTSVRELASKSLRSQALNSKALRVLSFVISDRGGQLPLNPVLQVATRVSRREVGVHFLMIEDSVSKNDVRGALKYYDLALKTSSESWPVLFPKLIGALDEGEVRAGLAPFVRSRPVWLQAFLAQAIRTSADPTTVAKLITSSGGWPEGPVYHDLGYSLIRQLVEKRQMVAAKQHYLSMKAADPGLLSSPDFVPNSLSERYGILSWQSIGTSSAGMTSTNGDQRARGVTLFAGAGDKAVVGRKLLFLGVGTHSLNVRFGDSEVPPGANVTFGMTCLSPTQTTPIWKSDNIRPESQASFSSSIRIPALCDAQNLDIEISGGLEQQATEIEIRSILVKRVAD